MSKILYYIILLIVVVLLSGLFSGAETGIYQMSRVRMRLGMEKNKYLFKLLYRCIKDSQALLLTILIGNNLTHYISTSIITALLLMKVRNERLVEIYATAIIAPSLFIFAELIPKNLYFYRADMLMPLTSTVLYPFKWFVTWTGVLPALKLFTGFVLKLTNKLQIKTTSIGHFRETYISNILRETHEEGLLTPLQSDIMFRLADVGKLKLRSVMTLLKYSVICSIETDKVGLRRILQEHNYSRYPVYEKNKHNVVGYIDIYECLAEDKEFESLRQFVRPIQDFDQQMSVNLALGKMQQEGLKILLVTRKTRLGRKIPVGIVTMKDLVEEFLGELSSW